MRIANGVLVIGIAVTHHVDYLLTWNLRHITNAVMYKLSRCVVQKAMRLPPYVFPKKGSCITLKIANSSGVCVYLPVRRIRC